MNSDDGQHLLFLESSSSLSIAPKAEEFVIKCARFDPPLPLSLRIHNVVLNDVLNLCAVVSDNALISITNPVVRNVGMGASDSVRYRCIPGYMFNHERVVQVKWSTHNPFILVVLSQNHITAIDTLPDDFAVVMSIPYSVPNQLVGFGFRDWYGLLDASLLLVSEKGELYSLCPFILPNSAFPRSKYEFIAEQALKSAQHGDEQAILTLRWLYSCFSPMVNEEERSSLMSMSTYSSRDEEDTECYAYDPSPHPHFRLNGSYAPALQGPLSLNPSLPRASAKVVSFATTKLPPGVFLDPETKSVHHDLSLRTRLLPYNFQFNFPQGLTIAFSDGTFCTCVPTSIPSIVWTKRSSTTDTHVHPQMGLRGKHVDAANRRGPLGGFRKHRADANKLLTTEDQVEFERLKSLAQAVSEEGAEVQRHPSVPLLFRKEDLDESLQNIQQMATEKLKYPDPTPSTEGPWIILAACSVSPLIKEGKYALHESPYYPYCLVLQCPSNEVMYLQFSRDATSDAATIDAKGKRLLGPSFPTVDVTAKETFRSWIASLAPALYPLPMSPLQVTPILVSPPLVTYVSSTLPFPKTLIALATATNGPKANSIVRIYKESEEGLHSTPSSNSILYKVDSYYSWRGLPLLSPPLSQYANEDSLKDDRPERGKEEKTSLGTSVFSSNEDFIQSAIDSINEDTYLSSAPLKSLLQLPLDGFDATLEKVSSTFDKLRTKGPVMTILETLRTIQNLSKEHFACYESARKILHNYAVKVLLVTAQNSINAAKDASQECQDIDLQTKRQLDRSKEALAFTVRSMYNLPRDDKENSDVEITYIPSPDAYPLGPLHVPMKPQNGSSEFIAMLDMVRLLGNTIKQLSPGVERHLRAVSNVAHRLTPENEVMIENLVRKMTIDAKSQTADTFSNAYYPKQAQNVLTGTSFEQRSNGVLTTDGKPMPTRRTGALGLRRK